MRVCYHDNAATVFLGIFLGSHHIATATAATIRDVNHRPRVLWSESLRMSKEPLPKISPWLFNVHRTVRAGAQEEG